jgi:hypothetical protein
MTVRSVNRRATQPSLRPLGQSEGPVLSKVGSELNTDARRSFIEDFNMEHSSFTTVTRVAISTGSDREETTASGRRSAQNQHSPSCVYFG